MPGELQTPLEVARGHFVIDDAESGECDEDVMR